jgi:protein TonB
MTGEFWDPFAPNEKFEPVRFPVVAPAVVAAPDAEASEAPAPWSPTDEATPMERYMLFGEPYDLPAPEPEPSFWPAMDDPTPRERYMLFGEPFEPYEPPPAAEVAPEAADAPDMVSMPPVLGWPFAPLPPPPAPDAPIFMPGEKPPTLTDITAPRLRLWRGAAMAAGLHVAVLGTALWFVRTRVPPPPPEGPVVAVVMEAPPQGDTSAAVTAPHPAPPARAKAPAPRLPLPPLPAPPVAAPADLSLPAPPPPPIPAALAKAAPPSPVQGVPTPAPLIGAETIKVTQPATPDARNAPPYYPPVARALGEEGQVNLSVEVLASGQVAHVVVAKSSGYPRLDEAARQSLLTWRFHPAMKDGLPIASVFLYYVRYQLQ